MSDSPPAAPSGFPLIPRFYQRLFRGSLVLLPYVTYVGMAGLMIVLIDLLRRFRRLALDRGLAQGLGAIALLLLISCLFAENKGEAFLQLTNFFPYFLFFGALPWMLREPGMLRWVAQDLVLTSIPMNAIALVEYLLKRPNLPLALQQMPLIAGVRSAPHVGRAMATFGHPNTFASYLVLVLGLGLGLILGSLQGGLGKPGSEGDKLPWRAGLYGGVVGCLVGIFCSGSRNGVLVAIAQLVLFSLLIKVNRVVRWVGLASGVGVVAIAASLGLGGRNLFSPTVWTNDPRIKVWQFGWELVTQRPLLGWGLGNFKFEYPPDLIPNQEPINHPHNFWLLLAAEAGIPALIGLTLLVGWVCYRAGRSLFSGQRTPEEHTLILSYGLGFFGCVAFALFDVTLYDVRVNALNWILLAGLFCLGTPDPKPHPLHPSNIRDRP